MGYLIPDDTMARLNELAAPLCDQAIRETQAVFADETAPAEDIAGAAAVNAAIFAVTSILRSLPLTQAGVIVAMGAISGTVLGQCEGDRALLYQMFKRQMAATLAEVAAGQMTPMGNA